MGLEDDLVPTGSKRIKSIPHSKEPDSSWRPEILPTGRTNKWPAESRRRLRLDAQWRITSSRGDVNVVILVAINPSSPQLVFEKWILDPNAGTLRPCASIRSSGVSGIRTQGMTRGPNNVFTTTGAPLIVTFDEMSIRTANPPQEFDIIVPVQALERIAHKIWMQQGI